jgi:hypothetical protein
MKPLDLTPGRALYNRVRAGFVLQDTSLGEYCRKNGASRQNATAALTGAWNGEKAAALRAQLIEASGVARGFTIAA